MGEFHQHGTEANGSVTSITDGQVYLAPDLYQKGILPAVDVGKSVSRVGGKTQLPDICLGIERGDELTSTDWEILTSAIHRSVPGELITP